MSFSRNKCEFTIGIDEETKKPTVGFRLGCYWAGSVAVAPVQGLKHIPENMKKAVLVSKNVLHNFFIHFIQYIITMRWIKLYHQIFQHLKS